MKTKLIESTAGALTGKRIAFSPVINFKYEETRDNTLDMSLGNEYRLEVRIGASEFLPVDILDGPTSSQHIYEAKKHIGRSITNAIYSDVQRKLFDILDEVRYKYPENRELIQKIYNTIEMMDF